ncbi:UNVERIFIED_CONTAM: hypothetical protein RMT77_003296 [Armadillidium vulgare]
MLNFSYDKVFTTFCIVIYLFSNEVLGNSKTLTNCCCGLKTYYQARVLGGSDVETNEFPWQAAVYIKGYFTCGGSIINNLYILSAGHCFNGIRDENNSVSFNASEILVALGVHERVELSKYKEMEEEPDIREIIEVILHEDFTSYNYYNDISLLKMKEPLTRYTFKISPICLPPSEPLYEDTSAIVSGWGVEKEKGTLANILRKINIEISENLSCSVAIPNKFKKEIMMCSLSENQQSCQGDSGGPLMIKNDEERYVQIGIVSFGFDCTTSYSPHLYTRLNRYLQWIKNQTRDATYCKY